MNSINTSLPILKGAWDWSEWRRRFKRAATAKRLWELFIEAETELEEPDSGNYYVSLDEARTYSAYHNAFENQIFFQMRSAAMNDYQLARMIWSHQQDRIIKALEFLYEHVDPHLWGSNDEIRTPAKAWAFLENGYWASQGLITGSVMMSRLVRSFSLARRNV